MKTYKNEEEKLTVNYIGFEPSIKMGKDISLTLKEGNSLNIYKLEVSYTGNFAYVSAEDVVELLNALSEHFKEKNGCCSVSDEYNY